MGLFDKFKKKKMEEQPIEQPVPQSPNTLAEDIRQACDWVVMALNSSGYKADFTAESMREIDRFFDEQNTPTGILSGNRGQILFALASYIGESVIKTYGGKWITNDEDPQGELNIAVELANGTIIWPAQRCMRRYMNGREDSIYDYFWVLDSNIGEPIDINTLKTTEE